MEKKPIVDRFYDAFKNAAHGRKKVGIQNAIWCAMKETSVSERYVRMFLTPMEVGGMIDVDRSTIWLVQDYGPRPKSEITDIHAEVRKEVNEENPNKKIREKTRMILRAERRKKKKI